MLKKFRVKGFKSFKDWLDFDLSSPNSYAFSTDCVKNGIIRAAVIHGINGTGKSNLGLALFDIFLQLTDYKKEDKLYHPYLNADIPAIDAIAEFEYHFDFDGTELIYSYGKKALNEIVYEKLLIDGKEIIFSDRRVDITFTCRLPGTESLRNAVSDASISILKYVKANTERDKSKENIAFDSLFDFVNKMLFFKCLEFNKYIGEPPVTNNVLLHIIEADKVREFEDFLHDCEVDCNLSVEGEGNGRYIVNNYKSKSYRLQEVWSTGTYALALFFGWSLRMRDGNVSFLFIDEFDAFYHFSLSRKVIKLLRGIDSLQFVLTTHNPATINNSILRPDCYFIIDKSGLYPFSKRTNRELREAHNLEKMYKADAFVNVEEQ